jgi:hypothetical protein
MEGKSNKQGIRWKNNQLVWCGLTIKAIIDKSNPIIMHGLTSVVKYVRLLWRELNGKRRWYAQLVGKGLPYQKPQNSVKKGTVGLDINLHNVAFVADNHADLLPFANKVPNSQREIAKLQRQMERSRRANNPNNYEPDASGKKGRKIVTKKGKPKKGKRKWNNSKTYLRTATKKRNIERKKSAYVKSQNRRLVNEILQHGNKIKTEKVSVKGWQKRYGKAIYAKGPGFFQSELKRKAENAGGQFTTFSTQKTALSQTHLDGSRIKKSLSERVHMDVTGFVMHRDLFSAFLSRYVNEDDVLELSKAKLNLGLRLESVLVDAWERFQQPARQVGESESRQSHSPSERASIKGRTVSQISLEGLKANFASA